MTLKNTLKISFAIFSVVLTTSCTTLFKEKITISQVVTAKMEIADTDNPAKKMILKNDLADKVIELKNITVKDVITSPNVDYSFCIVADVASRKGNIECFIFSKNTKKIAELKKNITRIDVQGNFGRYFSMLDSYFTKIEVLNASITILKDKKQGK